MKKQPDKITACYYRAANKQTDLNLDNQMHRLLSHAQENRSDTYMFFVDNGYSGLTAERPAFQNLLAAIHENRVQKIVVVGGVGKQVGTVAEGGHIDGVPGHLFFAQQGNRQVGQVFVFQRHIADVPRIGFIVAVIACLHFHTLRQNILAVKEHLQGALHL